MRRRRLTTCFAAASVAVSWCTPAAAALPGGTQDPSAIPKYEVPLAIPQAMPRSSSIRVETDGGIETVEYYEIAVREFEQQILPPGMPATTVWGYGSIDHPWTFHSPACTIEAAHGKTIRIKWINELVDAEGNHRPHLLPVDQTLHWANPVGKCADGTKASDCAGFDPMTYTGPVPIVTHVHGALVEPQYDGFAGAWYLPEALDLDTVAFTEGSAYSYFEKLAAADGITWGPGYAIYQYENEQNATALWYHDHAVGLARLNVYTGPAGFYILRGGQADIPKPGILPGPAPVVGDLPDSQWFEIPILIQDRSFNADGSLFYPDNRAFFEGLEFENLDIPFFPEKVMDGEGISDVAPIWNPEFFGNTMVVNGSTWPYLDVEPRRYRFRLLNGSQSRFLILAHDNDLPFWQIGADGGFLPEPIERLELLIGPAERADVIVDFGELPVGTTVTLLNLGPDEPFGGGEPDDDFDTSDPDTTGQVMQFRVVAPTNAEPDMTADPSLGELILPTIAPLAADTLTSPHRALSLNELESATVFVSEDEDEETIFEDPEDGEPFGPTAAMLGTYDPMSDTTSPLGWHDAVTENPALDATEVWELYNFTEDAHPIHVHAVQFEVVGRENLEEDDDEPVPLPGWEQGFKDTVIAYPEQVTRIKVHFGRAGLYTWHCHILEHEDNAMMRPYHVGKIPMDLPHPH